MEMTCKYCKIMQNPAFYINVLLNSTYECVLMGYIIEYERNHRISAAAAIIQIEEDIYSIQIETIEILLILFCLVFVSNASFC